MGNDRITTTLIPKAQNQLADLATSTGMSKTDLVNRAIQLLAFVEIEQLAGAELWLHHGNGTAERLHLL